jgi:hypothetical protein
LAIPLLIRAGYHFDLFPKLDLYLVGKLGYSFGIWDGPSKDMVEANGGTFKGPSGFAFGIDVGAAYYFTSNIGIFVEGGFDSYMLTVSASMKDDTGSTSNMALDSPFSRFITAGLSVKF